jgi:ABC transporter substrate binding protein (PQQ-dependent alcohol dehydrogenase system)
MKFILTLALLLAIGFVTPVSAQIDVKIAYLKGWRALPPTLSNLDPIPDDEGLSGAQLGREDNATTGKFLKQSYELLPFEASPDDDLTAIAREALDASDFLVLNATRADVLMIADMPEAQGKLIFNASAPDNDLRSDACRANVFHTLPSRAMLSDALAQFAVQKKWTDWALITGPREEDQAFAASLDASAGKFGVRIRDRKTWTFDADMRRNASAEVPLFTQSFPEHDMLIVADEANDYARYVMFNTWDPRPIGGSEGVVPAAWHRAVEQHGAAQLQSRFQELAARPMRSIDWAAWAAVRSIGEAVTRTNATDPASVRAFLYSDAFELGGFKGRKLSFRNWNGQLRQPIPLAHPGALVALAPLEGFLHRVNELDTLGLDEPESNCAALGSNE